MTPIVGLAALVPTTDALLCDVTGTLHGVDDAFPAALDALRRFRAGGGTVLLLSNAAAPAAALARSLAGRGVTEACYDAILTSADVARAIMARRGVRCVHHIGHARERLLFDGLAVRLGPAAEADLVACTGCPEGPLPEAALAGAAARGLDLLCTDPNVEAVAGGRVLRFAGMVAAGYAALGGRVVSTGKPDPAIYAAAIDRLAAIRGAPPEPTRILAVGDTPALDVEGALRLGYRALWVGRDASEGTADKMPDAFRLPALAW